MICTLPTDPQPLPVDHFMAGVLRRVHRHEALADRAEQLTGAPYRYSLSATASFTDLPVHLLRRLCRAGEIQAVKLSGRWLVHRQEFMRLLNLATACRSNLDRQIFVSYLHDLAAMLTPIERSSTISVLLKELRNAVQARRVGAAYDEAEGFAWRRAEWRVREGLVEPSQMDDALGLLRTIVPLGMLVFEQIGWRRDETAALTDMVRDQTGVQVWL